MTQVKDGWSTRTKTLEDIIYECENIESRRVDAYVKAINIVQGSKWFTHHCDSGLILKDAVMAELEKLK